MHQWSGGTKNWGCFFCVYIFSDLHHNCQINPTVEIGAVEIAVDNVAVENQLLRLTSFGVFINLSTHCLHRDSHER